VHNASDQVDYDVSQTISTPFAVAPRASHSGRYPANQVSFCGSFLAAGRSLGPAASFVELYFRDSSGKRWYRTSAGRLWPDAGPGIAEPVRHRWRKVPGAPGSPVNSSSTMTGQQGQPLEGSVCARWLRLRTSRRPQRRIVLASLSLPGGRLARRKHRGS
jgi:hypothetical protein